MSVKSIITAEVDDAAFKRFQAAFAAFQQKLTATGATWKVVNTVTASAGKTVQQTTAALNAQAAATTKIAANQTQFQRSTQNTAKFWSSIAKDSKTFAVGITDATRQLLRWSLITGTISGLLGGGGLFGISRLAQTASAGRRSSIGLGVSSGEQSAFGLNFGRFVETGTFLGGVNSALTDPTQRGGLIRGGLSENEFAGKNTAQTSVLLLKSLKKLADETDERNLGAVHTARGLGQFLSQEDFQRLKRTTPEELDSQIKHYGADQKSLNISPADQRAWTDFETQLKRAGAEIEKTFITGLTPLAGPLADLSESIVKVTKAFLESPVVKEWIVDLGKNLEDFAKYLGDPKFKKDVEDFTTGLNEMVEAIKGAVKWIRSWIPGSGSDSSEPGANNKPGIDPNLLKGKPSETPQSPHTILKNFLPKEQYGPPPPEKSFQELINPGKKSFKELMNPDSKTSFFQKYDDKAEEISKRTGVDKKIILAQAALESRYGASAPGNNFFGVKGPGGTYETKEFRDGKMVTENASFAGYKSVNESFDAYGDFLINNPRYQKTRQAKSLDDQITELGKSGYATDPEYAAKIRALVKQQNGGRGPREAQPRPATTNVTISNNTGGNANVSISQLA